MKGLDTDADGKVIAQLHTGTTAHWLTVCLTAEGVNNQQLIAVGWEFSILCSQ